MAGLTRQHLRYDEANGAFTEIRVDITIQQVHAIDLRDETFCVEFDAHFEYNDPWMKETKTKIWLDRDTYVEGFVEERYKDHILLDRGLYMTRATKMHNRASTTNREEFEAICTYRELKVDSYLKREEPASKSQLFASFFSTDSNDNVVVSLSELAEPPQILANSRRLCNGVDGTVRVFVKMIANFREALELKRFPFDRQLLRFKITSCIPTSSVQLTKGTEAQRVGYLSEYVVHKKGRSGQLPVIRAETKESKISCRKYSQIEVTVYVSRKPMHYIINVVFMLCVLTVASFANYCVPIQKTNDRLSNAVSFVLTSMALKYVVSDQLPKKAYQTHLDKYILVSYVVLCAPALELTLIWLREYPRVGKDQSDKEGEFNDKNVHIFGFPATFILFCCWIGYSIYWFGPMIWYNIYEKRRGIDWNIVQEEQEEARSGGSGERVVPGSLGVASIGSSAHDSDAESSLDDSVSSRLWGK